MLENILGIIFSIPFAFSILRITTPILFAALAAVVCLLYTSDAADE